MSDDPQVYYLIEDFLLFFEKSDGGDWTCTAVDSQGKVTDADFAVCLDEAAEYAYENDTTETDTAQTSFEFD